MYQHVYACVHFVCVFVSVYLCQLFLCVLVLRSCAAVAFATHLSDMVVVVVMGGIPAILAVWIHPPSKGL